jgi:hypothetical protein
MRRPPWSWIRAVLLMSQSETRGGNKRPLSPDDVRDAALSLQLPVMGIESEAQLLWIAVQFVTLPLPAGWLVQRADVPSPLERRKNTASTLGDDERGEIVFVNQQLLEERHVHPLQLAFREVLRSFSRFDLKTIAVSDQVDALSWLQFVDADEAVPYFYNFRTGQMQWGFPDLAELQSSSPLCTPRKQTVSEDAYMRTVPAFLAARSYVELLLATGVETALSLEARSCGCRSARLWRKPTPLAPLLLAARHLGIDPIRERRYMWIAHLSMCLPLPAGWLVHPTNLAESGADARVSRRRRQALQQYLNKHPTPDGKPRRLPEVYYEHTLLGNSSVQWEAPQLSYCRGLLHALRKHAAMLEAKERGLRGEAPPPSEGGGGAGDHAGAAGGPRKPQRMSRVSRDSASTSDKEAAERDQETAHAEGIRHWLKRMRHPGRAGIEYPYVTSLSGAKRLLYKPERPSSSARRPNTAGSQSRR